MQNIITQVSESSPGISNPLYNTTNDSTVRNANNRSDSNGDFANDELQDDDLDSYGNSLIHLNIQDVHYFITRDQLMALPESLLLCLFPSGVFLDRGGQIITNLTPNDEVYISEFSPKCFEYIMDVYKTAFDDLFNFPVDTYYNYNNINLFPHREEFLPFNNTQANNSATASQDILHEYPTIIVLREDLDYYCVPKCTFNMDFLHENQDLLGNVNDAKEELLQHIMILLKEAAGNYLCSKTSIFEGLSSSNKLKFGSSNNDSQVEDDNSNHKLGAAEQHLMNMLCSSGFSKNSEWANRTQELHKTVISSLSLCRLNNETTVNFRDKFTKSIINYDQQYNKDIGDQMINHQKKNKNDVFQTMNTSRSTTSSAAANNRLKRLSRGTPKLYDLVQKPEINPKLLLFWRKPARKCWWGEEDLTLEVPVYGHWNANTNTNKSIGTPTFTLEGIHEEDVTKLRIPIRLHIRRVWTLELNVVGVQ